jgi:hypothetical protein
MLLSRSGYYRLFLHAKNSLIPDGGILTTGAQINDISAGSTFSDSCDVLISATGALNEWKWPDIPGLHDFKGKLLHSANWDEEYDFSVSTIFFHSFSSY